jgi:hypothetical protein
MLIICQLNVLTLKDNKRFQLNTTRSETNCYSSALACILCNADVDGPHANVVNRFRGMHGEVHGSLVHVHDEVGMAVQKIRADCWACNVFDKVESC